MTRAVWEHYVGRVAHTSASVERDSVELVVDADYGTYADRAVMGLGVCFNAKIMTRRAHVTPSRRFVTRIGQRVVRAVDVLRTEVAWHMLPPLVRRRLGAVECAECEALLDASGFAYSDQWGSWPLEYMADRARQWRAKGKKLVILPQAFGPFLESRTKKALRRLLENADLVYARDTESYGYLSATVGTSDHLRQAPDFTSLVSGAVPADYEAGGEDAIIVPNSRMLDKVNPDRAKAYTLYLTMMIEEVLRRGMRPVLVYFSPEDVKIGRTLGSVMEQVHEVTERDAVHLKGIVGTARFVIGSRYHALVCALSQAIPTIGLGWSHKYRQLLSDYGLAEYLVSVEGSRDELAEKMDRVLDSNVRCELIEHMQRVNADLREQTFAMWADVDTVLGLHPSNEML